MTLDNCIEGYRILALACDKKLKLENVKTLYEEFYKGIDSDKFIQACRNLAKTYEKDKIPPVSIILGEIRNTAVQKPIEKIDWSKIKGMPDDLKDMLKNWEKEDYSKEKERENNIKEKENDLPF